MSDDFAQATEILPGRFYFTCVKRADNLRTSHIAATSICYSIDDELLFEPFFADFGPLNLGKAYRYCKKTQDLLQEADRCKKRLYHYCGPHPNHRANAAVLAGMFQVLFLNRTADDAFKPLAAFKPYVPFRDASCGASTFHLTVLDVLKGIQKARDVGFIDWNSGNSTWSIDEYEHYEQVENGDLNWIVPGKFLAFSGPAVRNNEVPGYRLFTPEDYWDYFKRKNVTAVVRLNKKIYDAKRFKDGNIRHYELYFPDGSCPSEAIILKFLEIAENEPGALAVHCKAGLGRTGVLICCYMMKHYRFTAEECIGYIRVARPGSIIGPQQNFMRDVEARMWQEGDMYRARKGGRPGVDVGLGAQDLAVSGKSALTDLHDAHGGQYASPAVPAYRSVGSAGMASAYGVRPNPSMPCLSVPLAGTNPADMSLLQYKMQHNLSVSTGGITAARSTPTTPTHVRAGSMANRVGAAAAPRGYAGRSITPMRYGTAGGSGMHTYGMSIIAAGQNGGASYLNPSQSGSLTPPLSPTGSGSSGPTAAVTKSTSSLPGRAPSADRASERSGSATASLRATLHTHTLQAAERPRGPAIERNLQSADITNTSWRGGSAGLSAAIGAARATPQVSAVQNSQQHKHVIARTLAPNGQPRKVPMSMLQQYHGLNGRSSAPNLNGMASVAAESSRVKSVAHVRYGMSTK